MKKEKRKIIGNFGENLACDFLKRKGYKIIERNLKLSYLEIDIIARHKKEVVFIEVKTRTTKDLGPAEDALRFLQIKKLKKAMVIYCAKEQINLKSVRLDLISVDLDKIKKVAKLKHYKNIF